MHKSNEEEGRVEGLGRGVEGHVYMYIMEFGTSRKKKKKCGGGNFFFPLGFAHLISFPGTPPAYCILQGEKRSIDASAEPTGL